MYNIIKAWLSPKINSSFLTKAKKYNHLSKITKQYICPVCQVEVDEFLALPQHYFQLFDKYQFIHSIFAFETLNLFTYSCPSCYASDRDRLYALYLNKYFSKFDTNLKYKVIDFAPTPSLAKFIKSFHFLEYRSADLFMEEVDDKVDITNLDIYANESIDLFVCSHILEHIDDDNKALKELYRILKPSGSAIIMVPIMLTLEQIYEDPCIKSEEDRWKHFGQNDHVRMYSKQGFIDKLTDVGFLVKPLGVEYFGTDLFNLYGIHTRSILYTVEK